MNQESMAYNCRSLKGVYVNEEFLFNYIGKYPLWRWWVDSWRRVVIKETSYTFLGQVGCAIAAPTGLVLGEGHFPGFNILYVLEQDLIMPLHVLGRLAADRLGDVLPPVRGVLVVDGKCPLKQLVLPWCPRWVGGAHGASCHFIPTVLASVLLRVPPVRNSGDRYLEKEGRKRYVYERIPPSSRWNGSWKLWGERPWGDSFYRRKRSEEWEGRGGRCGGANAKRRWSYLL